MKQKLRNLWEIANTRFINDYQLSRKPIEEWKCIPEMFAELIVNECVRKLEEDGMVEVAMEIKDHFGVEK